MPGCRQFDAVTQHDVTLVNEDQIARHPSHAVFLLLAGLVGDGGVTGGPDVTAGGFETRDLAGRLLVLRLLAERRR